MPRIEPVPYEHLSAKGRAMIEEGVANGCYPLENGEPPQAPRALGYSTHALEAAHVRSMSTWREGLLGAKLRELMRIRSAQVNGCATCSAVVKDDDVDGDAVACMIDMDYSKFTPREAAALKYVTQFGTDHHAIGDEDIHALLCEFSAAEVVELIQLAASLLGVHRMYSVLKVTSDCAPIIRFDPDLVDAGRMRTTEAAE